MTNYAGESLGGITVGEFWKTVTCPQEMIELASRRPWVTRAQLVRCLCVCARLVLDKVPYSENSPRDAILAAEKWCDDPTRNNEYDSYAAGSRAIGASQALPSSMQSHDATYAAGCATRMTESCGSNLSYMVIMCVEKAGICSGTLCDLIRKMLPIVEVNV